MSPKLIWGTLIGAGLLNATLIAAMLYRIPVAMDEARLSRNAILEAVQRIESCCERLQPGGPREQ